jgi:sphingomyelin phosphodiesterase
MEEKSITRNVKKDSTIVSIIQYGGLTSENRIITSKGIPITNIEQINIKKNNSSNLADERIRLLTYNIFCRPPPINTNIDYKDSRLNDFMDQLKNFDIICFQELFTTLNDRKHRMIREGATQGLKYYLAPKVPSFFSKYLVDSGLLILSRYPIVEHDFYEYFLNISGDATTDKGVLYSKIEIKKNKFLFLFNTHLQASYFDDT